MNVKKLIQKRETTTLELKPSLSQIDDIVETVSAFSNTRGGIIAIGIANNGKIAGVEIGKDTIERLSNKIMQNTDPRVHPEISVEDVDEKKIILVKVRESTDKLILAFGRPYKRVGSSTTKMSKEEYERMILEKHKDRLQFDKQICEGATLKDIDSSKVRWFLGKANEMRRFDIPLNISAKEALKRLDLVAGGKLTNAAILLFGKRPQRFFSQAETRCARFKGTEPLEFIDMKVFGGNIINQRDDAVEFVKEHINLHAKIAGTERAERWEYPIEAVREAVTNAVCHRNYEIASNVQVRVFDDRIEIWGCGPLPEPLTVEDLKKKHDSVLRNALIGKCFFLIKYIEQWGTGTNRIIKECLKHGLPEPLFELISESLVVTFRKHRLTERMLGELNERQRKAIDLLKQRGKITNKDFQKLCPAVTRETLRKDLKDMADRGIIARKGTKRGVYYELA